MGIVGLHQPDCTAFLNYLIFEKTFLVFMQLSKFLFRGKAHIPHRLSIFFLQYLINISKFSRAEWIFSPSPWIRRVLIVEHSIISLCYWEKMESISVCGGLVDIQLTQADSYGDSLSIPLFNYTPAAHLIKLPINSIKQVRKLTTQTLA